MLKIFYYFWEGNDLSTDPDEYNLTNELKNPILNKYLENKNFTQNLIYRQSEIDNYVKVLNQHYVNIESGQKKYFCQKFETFQFKIFYI